MGFAPEAAEAAEGGSAAEKRELLGRPLGGLGHDEPRTTLRASLAACSLRAYQVVWGVVGKHTGGK